MGRLDGKVAIVSGAARGQGAAEARQFVAEGAKVVLGDVLHEEGELVAKELGDSARYVPLDVTDEAAWATAVETATSTFGGLNILVNNAGVAHMPTPIAVMEPADYRRVIEINQIGTFLGMHAAIPAIVRGAPGSIVNISSVNGFVGAAGMSAYVSTKSSAWAMLSRNSRSLIVPWPRSVLACSSASRAAPRCSRASRAVCCRTIACQPTKPPTVARHTAMPRTTRARLDGISIRMLLSL